jgi:HK97 gp10 family phage protein
MKITVSKVWKGAAVKVAGKRVTGKSAYEIGLIVEGQAKLLAPKDTGYLAASITTQAFGYGTEPESPSRYTRHVRVNLITGKWAPTKPPSDTTWMDAKISSPPSDNEVHVGTPLFYAPYVEFGTVKSEAQPFLRPSLDLAKGKTLSILEHNGRMQFAEYMK